MRFSSSLALAAASALLPMAPAAAADYEPPMIIDQAPNYVPVEVGSGWYLRGDVSYNVNDSVYDFELFGEEADNLRFGGGIGIGYHFNDLFRADVNLSYISHDSYDYDDGINSGSVENTVGGALLNAYLDLGTFVGVTPYVGAGVGLLYSKYDASVTSPTIVGGGYAASDRQYTFAYALNAGLSYQMTRNMSVDVGYQYLNAPNLEYIDVGSDGEIKEGVHYHQIRVGLRYDLW